jgi:hypothetical protein
VDPLRGCERLSFVFPQLHKYSRLGAQTRPNHGMLTTGLAAILIVIFSPDAMTSPFEFTALSRKNAEA